MIHVSNGDTLAMITGLPTGSRDRVKLHGRASSPTIAARLLEPGCLVWAWSYGSSSWLEVGRRNGYREALRWRGGSLFFVWSGSFKSADGDDAAGHLRAMGMKHLLGLVRVQVRAFSPIHGITDSSVPPDVKQITPDARNASSPGSSGWWDRVRPTETTLSYLIS